MVSGHAATKTEKLKNKKFDWLLMCALAWFIPGSGHIWVGRRNTGLIFLGVLSLMFFVGLWISASYFIDHNVISIYCSFSFLFGMFLKNM